MSKRKLSQTPPTSEYDPDVYSFPLGQVIRNFGSLLNLGDSDLGKKPALSLEERSARWRRKPKATCRTLDITDCARLAVVSKEYRDAVNANKCWQDVMEVLEQDFPLVPLRVLNEWRLKLKEPRYDTKKWALLTSKQRVPLLLEFAQKIVKKLRILGTCFDGDDNGYVPQWDRNAEVGSTVRGVVMTEKFLNKEKHNYHIQKHFTNSWDLAFKLGLCCLLEYGFRQDLFYIESDNALNDEEFEWDHLRDYLIDNKADLLSGTDEHLDALFNLANASIFTEDMFGPSLFYSLIVTPRDAEDFYVVIKKEQPYLPIRKLETPFIPWNDISYEGPTTVITQRQGPYF
jgi:hypothetical protein